MILDLGKYIKTKVELFISKIDFNILDPLDPEVDNLQVTFDFYVAPVVDGNVIIPIGTKHERKGLSATKKKLFMAFDIESNDYLLTTKDAVIQYRRDNKELVKNELSNDYQTMCMVTPFKELKSFCLSKEVPF